MADLQRAYEIAFLITGSHIDAEIARAKAGRACPACGDEITTDDETVGEMHRDCAEAGADIGYTEAAIW